MSLTGQSTETAHVVMARPPCEIVLMSPRIPDHEPEPVTIRHVGAHITEALGGRWALAVYVSTFYAAVQLLEANVRQLGAMLEHAQRELQHDPCNALYAPSSNHSTPSWFLERFYLADRCCGCRCQPC